MCGCNRRRAGAYKLIGMPLGCWGNGGGVEMGTI